MVSVAGIRGVVGRSLLPETFLDYALAFAATVDGRGPVVVGSDSRLSRELLRHLLFAGLTSSGLDIVDIGIAPTPTVGLMVRELGAAGGVAITASHNPAEWNAYKFFAGDGTFLSVDGNRVLQEKLATRAFRRAGVFELGKVTATRDAIERHLVHVLRETEVAAIRHKKFKVVVDCCNGAGGALTKRLLKELGCRATLFATEMDVAFHRVAEPLPEHLGELGRRVVKARAHLGFALDPDADRLAIVDETGRAIGEERTLCLAADAFLARHGGRVVVANLSTTMALDEVARRHGARVVRTKIGEAHVVAGMQREGARIGGEGNGGVIWPAVHPGRDAAGGMALVLEGLARRGGTLSAWNASFPDYAMRKERLPVAGLDLAAVFDAIRRAHRVEESHCDRADGLKLILAEATVHVRPSGTEPIVRIFVESPSASRNAELWEITRAALPTS